MSRIAAGVTVLPILLGTAWLGLWVSLGVSVTVNPFEPDGDPCCTHPQTWNDVWSGATWTVAAAFAEGLLLAAAVALVAFAIKGCMPRWHWLVPLPLVSAVAVAGLLVVLLYPQRNDPRWETGAVVLSSPPGGTAGGDIPTPRVGISPTPSAQTQRVISSPVIDA